ncbi:MAG: DNA mismatch repair protein MutS, partial [Chloroflexi bacterium]|nr:DNA mismatch repair protein MutS [Chloroflexota bacterium]
MKDGVTPIRQQYLRVKRQYPQAIVLFRVGDFYETFDDDAKLASRELEIVLTAREMGKGHSVPMAGIPYHALDNYLARLINRGYKVAICEQVTKPGETKGLVQREVVRLVTPGTVVEPVLLDSKTNNYLVSLAPGEEAVGIAYVDITTSEFATTQLPYLRANTEIERLKPSEVIAGTGADLSGFSLSMPVSRLEDYHFQTEAAQQALLQHFGVATLEGYGCAGLPLAVAASGAIIHYLSQTQKVVLGQLTRLSTYTTGSYMALDVQTQRNLELFQSGRGSADGSLLSILDLTKTAMGGRLLRRWLGQPLLDLKELMRRQEAVEWFHGNNLLRSQIISTLGGVADLERLVNRVRSNIALPRELVALRRSLETIPALIRLLEAGKSIEWTTRDLRPCPEIVALVSAAIEEQPGSLEEGGVIRTGFSEELDKLRSASKNARQYLASLEQKERERTGIKSLKLGFNRVFGYYIEVSKSNLAQVPADYIRKQTLVGGERFFT